MADLDPAERGRVMRSDANYVELSPILLTRDVLRQRGLLITLPVLVTVVFGALWLWRHEFSANASFAPAAPSAVDSKLSSLAAEFGLGGAPSGPSLQFYQFVATSREIFEGLARDTFSFSTGPGPGDRRSGTLETLLEIDGDSPDDSLMNLFTELADRVQASTSADAGVITVTVTMPWPELAEQVTSRVLQLVDHFNLQQRRSSASQQRAFARIARDSARTKLEGAEAEMQAFLNANASVGNSPRLEFERTRLQRRIDLYQGIYVSVAQAYEQAGIDEARDTPVITVVDAPEHSARPSQKLIMVLALGFILGALLAALVALARLYLHHQAEVNSDEYGALVAELGQLPGVRQVRRFRNRVS